MGVVLGPVVGTRLSESIAAGNILAIDTNGQNSFKGIRYFLSAFGNNRTTSMDITVVNDNGFLSDNIFGKAGNGISMNILIKFSGTDTVLEVTNNELFSIELEVLKFITGLS